MQDLEVFNEDLEYQHAGMIDWLTLKIDLTCLSPEVISKLRKQSARLFRVKADGELDWESFAWDSVRSDTHQVAVRVGGQLHIQGSPARVGLLNNAFGSLDIQYCARKMIHHVAIHMGLGTLPGVELWTCSRIDVTRNYLMQSDAEARQAMEYLKQSSESKQKHSYESNGLYIGKGSALHKGKIYLKGQDARRNQRYKKAVYTEEQLDIADRLLRSEYTLARHKIRRLLADKGISWHQLTPQKLLALHDDYFKDYMSQIEVTDMGNILARLRCVTPTEGQADSAYDCYTRIRMIGFSQAKASFTKTTWHRHIKNLKLAGLSRADLQPINIIPLRKRAIEVSQPLRHWDDVASF